jgi:hypothetical protein
LKNQLRELWLLEQAFDQLDSVVLQQIIANQNSLSSLAKLVYLAGNDDLQAAIDYGRGEFESCKDPVEKGFIHHWVIGCMESLYQEDSRQLWLEKWSDIESWTEHPWLRFTKKYQMAIGLYFDSHFREALSLFEQLTEEARTMGYPRGQEKCLYHKALIYKCINHNERALGLIKRAKEIAQSRGSERGLLRIERVQQTLSDLSWHASLDLNTIEILLKENKNLAARKLLLHSLRQRRIEKREWGAYSEHMYMALVALSFGRLSRFEKIYRNHLKDNLIKEKTIGLAKQIGNQLPRYFTEELSYLRQIQGISSTLGGKTSEFLGVNLQKIKDHEVVAVIRSLSSSIEGMSKEQLCVKLWNYNYDPFLHDRRIYKLIHRIKNIFNCRDAIIAKGGLYRINPKYLNC